jgi:butyrophilin
MGSTPLISIMGYVGRGIQLLCQSSSWLSQPIVKWKDSEGLELPADSKVNKDSHGWFDVETSLVVQENSEIISCSMLLADQGPEMKSRILIDSELKRGRYYVALWRKRLSLNCLVLFYFND